MLANSLLHPILILGIILINKTCKSLSDFRYFHLILQLWDLSAGRLLADFKHHEGPVTSVQFHPRDYLLASGSSDRTTKIWDLETFQLLSESLPESNSIRCVLFHPEGTALFSGSQDSLKVCYVPYGSYVYDILYKEGEQQLLRIFREAKLPCHTLYFYLRGAKVWQRGRPPPASHAPLQLLLHVF